jgi:hypothetical protein
LNIVLGMLLLYLILIRVIWGTVYIVEHDALHRIWIHIRSSVTLDVSYITAGHVKGTAVPVQAVEALRVVRGWVSHNFQTFGSQMAVRLSALRAGGFFTPQENSWYSFLLEAESTPGPWCGWKD